MCQVAPERCVGNPCMNGAQCQDFGSGLNCTCSADYTGVGCQYEFDACEEGLCQNGATCYDHGEGYQCICPPGYEGEHCEKDIVDCVASACSPRAECIDLTNEFYCNCPFNYTGDDCRKQINYDYDLFINDDSKMSSASLVTPFDLKMSKSLSIALWVQFASPDDKGIVFTLFSVDNPNLPLGKRVILQATDSGMIIELVEGQKELINYWPNIPINDGQWHHLAIIWDGEEETLTLTTDSVIVATVPGYGSNQTSPEFGYITLGAVEQAHSSYSDVRGFHGRVARLNVWDKPINYKRELTVMAKDCMQSPVIFDGLLLRWSGYEKIQGNVERIGPSACGKKICPPGYFGDCDVLQRDKTPPRVDHCPGDIWAITANGSSVINWDEPIFSDNLKIAKIDDQSGYMPGQMFTLGTYHVATVAYDEAGNSATCSFDIHVLEEFCEDLEDPVGGTQTCTNWGPGGRFKVCQIACNPGLSFSTKVPDFYTCGAEGFWRPTEDPSTPMVYPTCSRASPAQRVFKIKMQFPSSDFCNNAGQSVLSKRIRVALAKLNSDWNICTDVDANSGACKGLNVDVKCSSDRTKRQANEEEAEPAYVASISFPATSDPVQHLRNNEESTILRLLQEMILQDDQFDVTDALPTVRADPSSLNLVAEYSCPVGKVVIEENCVSCVPGEFFERVSKSCQACAVASYSDEFGQLECKKCPAKDGMDAITRSKGASSAGSCFQKCSAGRFFDFPKRECRPCGYGYFQPSEGQVKCDRCDVGMTTGVEEAVSKEECREECQGGYQLTSGKGCEACAKGTFRTTQIHRSCMPCPANITTAGTGAQSADACILPVCQPGTYLIGKDGIYNCMPCAKGSYQPETMASECLKCPDSTSTKAMGSTSKDECYNPCQDSGEEVLCDANADCLYLIEKDEYVCECKSGFNKTDTGDCLDNCNNFCKNEGECKKDNVGMPFCECTGSFTGKKCQTKSQFLFVASGVAGAAVFIIILVLLVWMICLRSTKKQDTKKILPPTTMDPAGSQVNFYYGQPAPYAESIAPSHHSNYAYYDDEEDTWEMPNFPNLYNDTYAKSGYGNNSLARSNASIYGNKEDIYDRLRKHAYQGKKEKDDTESESPGAH